MFGRSGRKNVAYSSMALPHATSAQPIDIQPLGTRLASARTVALFKATDIEVMRLILLAGSSVPPHKVAGDITIQCIEGKIEVTAEGRSQILTASQLMYLSGGALHSLAGIEDASVLVTIALRTS